MKSNADVERLRKLLEGKKEAIKKMMQENEEMMKDLFK